MANLLLLSTRNFGPDYQTYFDLFNEPSTAFGFFNWTLEPFWPLFMVTPRIYLINPPMDLL